MTAWIRVQTLDDPRLSDYRNVRDKDLLRDRQSFLAEGEVVLSVLLAQERFPLRSVLAAENRALKLSSRLLQPSLAQVPLYMADQALLDQIAGFHIHRGILASATRVPVPSPKELLARMPGARRILLLEGILNHDNVGGIFRNAAALGADAVLLDGYTCDPLYRKALRVSVGGSLLVPYARAAPGETGPALVKAAREAGFCVLSLSPRADAEDIESLRAPGALPEKVALLLGTEGEGLSAEALNQADRTVRIRMAPGFDSLNVGVAAGIALFALRTAATDLGLGGRQ